MTTEAINPDAIKARHMLLLPPNLATLAKLTGETGRFGGALASVLLEATERGYCACATNGKALGMVKAEMPGEPEEYPTIPALKNAPNSGTSALIPTDSWAEAFKLVPKKTRHGNPILANVAAVLGATDATFAATDLDKARSLHTRQAEGRFPDYKAVLPTAAPLASITIDPASLAELLTVALQFADEGNTRVTLELRDQKSPVVVRAQNGEQEFTGLLMPLL